MNMRFFFTFCACTLAACKSNAPGITEFIANMPLDEATAIPSPFGKLSGTVCLLVPYQQSVGSENPDHIAFNSYLKKAKFLSDEGHWSLVYKIGGDFIIKNYEIVKNQRILNDQTQIVDAKITLPKEFNQKNCLNIEKASLIKKKIENDKSLLIFGEMHVGV